MGSVSRQSDMIPDESWITEQELSASNQKAVDAECDRFEAAWMTGRPTNIENHIAPYTNPAVRAKLLYELVLVDLEYSWQGAETTATDRGRTREDWQYFPGASRLPPHPQLEDYLVRYPQLRNQPRAQFGLIVAEYRVRQQWGDRPKYEDYHIRFPHFEPNLESALRTVAMELTPSCVRVYRHRDLVFSTRLSFPLEIGRQKMGEPPPYCWQETNGGGRIIIAPLEDNRISRSHVYLDIVAKNEFRVENRSAKSSLYIYSVGRLPPDGGRYVTRPLLIKLGQIAVSLMES